MVVGGVEAVVSTMLYNIIIEAIGISAGVLVLVGMCFKTSTFKSTFVLRILNIIGPAIFVVYGALLPAISTAVLNAALVVVNTVYLILLVKNHKKELAAKNQTNTETDVVKEEKPTETMNED